MLKDLWKRQCRVVGVDDLIVVVRESDNRHDPMAVAVYLASPRIRLGYLPCKHSWVAEALDEGRRVSICFEGVRREGPVFFRRYLVDLSVIAEG